MGILYDSRKLKMSSLVSTLGPLDEEMPLHFLGKFSAKKYYFSSFHCTVNFSSKGSYCMAWLEIGIPKGKYFLTLFGKSTLEIQILLGMVISNYWILKTMREHKQTTNILAKEFARIIIPFFTMGTKRYISCIMNIKSIMRLLSSEGI